jgi:hypothetical protein
MGDEVQVPRDYLELMQEPILTRWGTVGDAAQYVNKYLDVLVTLADGLCGNTTKSSNIAMCAGNFASLAEEEEIVIDLSFLADFDKIFFHGHLAFNHSTDPGVGRTGFLAHHHLVRYCLKRQDLEKIVAELDAGTIDQSPEGAKLKSFWGRLTKATDEVVKTRCLMKAKDFMEVYFKSLVKHNAQFVSPALLFLATFGEGETGSMVARMLRFANENPEHELCATDLLLEAPETRRFRSEIQKQTIDLEIFADFLVEMCWENAQEAMKTHNFNVLRPLILQIAGGRNIWDGSVASQPARTFYLQNFGAFPSTTEMVERSVKKAKLCQKTGKGERNVTAYGIAGDGVKELCAEQLVSSSYPARMDGKRKELQQRAEDEGREARSKKAYKEDLARGPSCIRNTVNQALLFYKKVWEIRERIGQDEYDKRFTKTYEMLTSLDKQGSTARYSQLLEGFEANLGKAYAKGPRQLEKGVTLTAHNKREIPYSKLKAHTHVPALVREAFARGLGTGEELGVLNYTALCKKIKADVKEKWMLENLGKEVPENLKQTFMPVSDADFSYVD